MYKQWLSLTCKWATVGLTQEEYSQWDKLSTQLNKHCNEESCTTDGTECVCQGIGLTLTAEEKVILNNIDSTVHKGA